MGLRSAARAALFFSSVLLTTSVLAQDKFVEGQHYERAASARPTSSPAEQVEVAEVFMYWCPHCFNFDPYFQEWVKRKPSYVTVVRLPASFSKLGELQASAYYTAESLGIIDRVHDDIFRAIHVDKRDLSTQEHLRDFFRSYGIEPALFDETLGSADVESKVRRADGLIKGYGIKVTPTVVVNGKYLTTLQAAGSYETWFDIIDELIARERGEVPKVSTAQ
jgi:thiol:disulfide interchange protein DsbA